MLSVLVILILGAFVYQQHAQIVLTRTIYFHPKTVEKVRVVRVEGPVRIVTKTVERAGGEKETTVTETRAPVEERAELAKESTPVPLAVALAAPRTDRWIGGLRLREFSPKSYENYDVLAGYSFKNRLDLVYGVGYADGFKNSLEILVRF